MTADTLTAGPAASKKKPARQKKSSSGFLNFFRVDPVQTDRISDETAENEKRAWLLTIVTWEAVAIGVLTLLLLLAAPLLQPIYLYYAMNPQHKTAQLPSLAVPNMTNRAILSWATIGITEIMTIGFGDFESKLMAQKWRFTSEGWDDFVDAFLTQKIGESFKERQLVLTTVPSNTPVIVAQGINSNRVYEWHVQMPVIMTYATNNNVTRRERAIISLLIVRVPVDESPAAIAIKTLSLVQ